MFFCVCVVLVSSNYLTLELKNNTRSGFDLYILLIIILYII